MREILFRGKRKDNGKWVYGYYFANPISTYILPTGWEISSSLDCVQVIPSSVGQYTGLIDKNETKIFEGDITRFKWNDKEHVDIIKYSAPLFSPSKSFRWSMRRDEVIGNIHDNPELLEVRK